MALSAFKLGYAEDTGAIEVFSIVLYCLVLHCIVLYVQKLNARVHELRRKLNQQEQVKHVPYSRTNEQLAKDLLQFLSGPTVDFAVSQVHVAKGQKETTVLVSKGKDFGTLPVALKPRDLQAIVENIKLSSVKILSRILQNIQVFPNFNVNISEGVQVVRSCYE